MKSMKRYPLLFLGLALAMMILSACGQSSSPPSSLTPLTVMQKSAIAMKDLKTSHIDLDETFQVNGAIALGTQTLPNTAVTLKGSGDQSIPDKQQQMDLTLTMPNLSTQVSDVIISDKAYIKIGQGRWYVVDTPNIDYTSGVYITSVFSSPTINLNSLLKLIEHTHFTDHGSEIVHGQPLRHITVNMKKDALQLLVSDNPHLKSNFSSLNLNAVKNCKASVDVYIDENQFYVHRTVLQVDLDTDDNNIMTSTTINVTTDLSKFNQPVTITEPANATLLTDLKQLLSGITVFH